MCLGIPAKVIEIDKESGLALVETLQVKRWISLHIMDDEVKPGEYLMIHAGFAIGKIEEKEAEESLSLLKKLGFI